MRIPPQLMLRILAAEMMSWAVGVAYGRFDVRLATGEHALPPEPDPFAPLPVCPPGMLLRANGLPAAPEDVPVDYPIHLSWSGILVDDEGHPEGIVSRARQALEVIWQERASDIEHEACDTPGCEVAARLLRQTRPLLCQPPQALLQEPPSSADILATANTFGLLHPLALLSSSQRSDTIYVRE